MMTNLYSNQYNSPWKAFGNNDVANPCGLVAKSFINGTLSIKFMTKIQKNVDSFKLRNSSRSLIPISENDISWSVDKTYKFHNNNNWALTQWTNIENGIFVIKSKK